VTLLLRLRKEVVIGGWGMLMIVSWGSIHVVGEWGGWLNIIILWIDLGMWIRIGKEGRIVVPLLMQVR